MSDYDLFGDFDPEQPATLEEDKPQLPPRRPSRRPRRRGSRGGFYNFVSALFVLATVGVCAAVVMLIQNPTLPFNPFPPVLSQPTPTLFVLQDGGSGGIGFNPTVPPDAAATSTRVPTSLPPALASTLTPGFQPSATGIAVLPIGTEFFEDFPFAIQNDAVTYTQHPEGCDGLWIVGQVFDLNSQPLVCGQAERSLPCLPVEVRGEVFGSEIQFSGSAPQWGPSGYEFKVNGEPVEDEFEVRLLNTTGQPLSDVIVVRTLASCERNVAVVNFIQIIEIPR